VVADLGCGRGQVGVLLLEAGAAAAVTGLDRAGPALADARRAAAGLPYVAQMRDLAQDPLPAACDTVLLIDVLYQLGPEPARRLLAAAAAVARRRILVRTLDPGLGWRSRLAVALERLGRLGWPHSGRHVVPLPVDALCALLRECGFDTEVSPSWQGTPFANVLVDARRR
jgi:SAM-dependent methyltransferase